MIINDFERQLKDGYYLVKVDKEDLVIAEMVCGNWHQCGADYDVWRCSEDEYEIEIICKLDLEEISRQVEEMKEQPQ